MIKVLGRKTSGNVQKVVWLLEELEIPYERQDYGRQFNNTQSDDYLRLNPNGKVPTLVDGDTVIWESNTILRYIAAKSGHRLYATDLAARSRIERWMDWQLATLDQPYLAIFREAKNPPDQRSAQFPQNVATLGQTLAILERGMDGAKWVAGGEMTIADICLGPVVHRCFNFGVELPALKNLRRWREEIAKRPAFQKATG
jgi:glutathione S-transferase